MTKAELRRRLNVGEQMADLFEWRGGEECDIYKAEQFEAGEDIIYIPDIYLNEIQRKITSESDIDEIIESCYTGDDFLELMHGDMNHAAILFDCCCWQHPSAILDEGEDWTEE